MKLNKKIIIYTSASVDDAVVFRISVIVVGSVASVDGDPAVVPSTRLPGVVPSNGALSVVVSTPGVVSTTGDDSVVLSAGTLLVVLETTDGTVVPSAEFPLVVSSTLGSEVVEAAVEVVVSGSFGFGVFVVNLAAVVVVAHSPLDGQLAHSPLTLTAFL